MERINLKGHQDLVLKELEKYPNGDMRKDKFSPCRKLEKNDN